MAQKVLTRGEGLTNFTQNIKGVMLKCRHGEKLTKDEQEQIVQFYLEVCAYLANS